MRDTIRKTCHGDTWGSKHEAYAESTTRGLPDGGILMSGGQTDQTSADAIQAKTEREAELYCSDHHVDAAFVC